MESLHSRPFAILTATVLLIALNSSTPNCRFGVLLSKAQSTTAPATTTTNAVGPAPSPTTSTGSPLFGGKEFRSVYVHDDLILVFPLSSTILLVAIVLFSTGLEFVFEKAEEHSNTYVRGATKAAKDEVVGLAFAHMLLILVSISVDFSPEWRSVLLYVSMLIVFMCYCLILYLVFLILQFKRLTRYWRDFEWARIDNDADHDQSERRFKMARQFFLFTLPASLMETVANGRKGYAATEGIAAAAGGAGGGAAAAKAAAAAASSQQQLQAHLLILFSSYTSYVMRSHLGDVVSFSSVTWFGLGFFIIVNGLRAVTVASIRDTGVLAHAISFVFVIGYGALALLLVCYAVFQRRFTAFLLASSTSPDGDPESNRVPDYMLDRTKAQAEARKSLLFRSTARTTQLIRIMVLTEIWFFSYFFFGLAVATFKAVQWYALLIYILAVIPPLVTASIVPGMVHSVFTCAAVCEYYQLHKVRAIILGHLDVTDDNDDGGAEDEKEEKYDNAGGANIEGNGEGGAQWGIGIFGMRPSTRRKRQAPTSTTVEATAAAAVVDDDEDDGFGDEWSDDGVRLNTGTMRVSGGADDGWGDARGGGGSRRGGGTSSDGVLGDYDIPTTSLKYIVRQPRPVFEERGATLPGGGGGSGKPSSASQQNPHPML